MHEEHTILEPAPKNMPVRLIKRAFWKYFNKRSNSCNRMLGKLKEPFRLSPYSPPSQRLSRQAGHHLGALQRLLDQLAVLF